MPDLLETGPYRDRTIQRPDQARPIQLRLKINVTEARRDRTLKELSGSCNRHPPPPRLRVDMTVVSSNPTAPGTASERGLASESTVPPLTAPSTTQLLAIWRETLHAADASIDENFFDTGGTSLLAARLAARIKAQLGCAITAADILSHPCVRQLAKKLGGTDAALDRGASDQRAAMQRRAFSAKRPTR